MPRIISKIPPQELLQLREGFSGGGEGGIVRERAAFERKLTARLVEKRIALDVQIRLHAFPAHIPVCTAGRDNVNAVGITREKFIDENRDPHLRRRREREVFRKLFLDPLLQVIAVERIVPRFQQADASVRSERHRAAADRVPRDTVVDEPFAAGERDDISGEDFLRLAATPIELRGKPPDADHRRDRKRRTKGNPQPLFKFVA